MKKIYIFLGMIFVAIFGFLSLLNRVYADEINEKIPELYIKAINPGYVVDGKNNVGEMIEIARKNADAPISLAGTTIGYTNSSGNYTVLVEFPENSWMTSETLLLRLASSPDSELAALNYAKTLAFKAGVDLRINDEVADEVCWTGKDECYVEFKSASPTTLVRNLETGNFEHLVEYEPVYDVNSYRADETKEDEGYGMVSQCAGLMFSEILSYYESIKAEQFIEIYNPTSEQILLDGCKIRYKNKDYNLGGIIPAEKYYLYYPKGFSLTKNPTNFNSLELVDVDGKVVSKMTYPNGQRKGTSYAFIGYDSNAVEIWKTTYAPTPGEPNNYQEFKTCEAGKVLNEATGNCVKVTSVEEKTCKDGYFLNILTGRCNKVKTVEEKTCKEGYYLNPETNRCKKIKENTGANYSLEPEKYEEESSFVALYVVIGVVLVGLGYLVYEFRHEILKLFRKVFRRFH